MQGVAAYQVSHRRPIPLVIKASCRVLRLIMEVPEARDYADASSSCDTLHPRRMAVAVLSVAVVISAINAGLRSLANWLSISLSPVV